MVEAVLILLVIGLIGLAMSAKTIWDYGEVVEMGALNYAYGPVEIKDTHYTTARQSAYADQKLMNLSDTIYKVRDMCIEDERIQVADERAELFELLAQAAVLVDTIRARS